MIIFKYIIISFIGLSSGVAVSAGVFAFIVVLGLVNKAAGRMGSAAYINLYENSIIAGAVIWNIVYLFADSLKGSYVMLLIIGVFCGIFVGMLGAALAEVTKVIPMIIMRMKISKGLPYIIISIALGKAVGSAFGLIYK